MPILRVTEYRCDGCRAVPKVAEDDAEQTDAEPSLYGWMVLQPGHLHRGPGVHPDMPREPIVLCGDCWPGLLKSVLPEKQAPSEG